MVLSPYYEIVEIADEVIAVPIGERVSQSKDVFSFSKAAATVVKRLKSKASTEDLIDLLTREFDVDKKVAQKDLADFISLLQKNELIV